MSLGKELGSFSFKITSSTYEAEGTRVNVEGAAEGFGPVTGTLVFRTEPGQQTIGTVTWRGAAFPENGAVLSGVGEGSYEALGRHQWRTRSVIRTSDGRIFGSDGVIDIAKRTFTGKNLEWS